MTNGRKQKSNIYTKYIFKGIETTISWECEWGGGSGSANERRECLIEISWTKHLSRCLFEQSVGTSHYGYIFLTIHTNKPLWPQYGNAEFEYVQILNQIEILIGLLEWIWFICCLIVVGTFSICCIASDSPPSFLSPSIASSLLSIWRSHNLLVVLFLSNLIRCYIYLPNDRCGYICSSERACPCTNEKCVLPSSAYYYDRPKIKNLSFRSYRFVQGVWCGVPINSKTSTMNDTYHLTA